MSAITEIPANTPSPIGSTDNFFPGSVNAAVAEFVDCAAAAETDVVESATDDPDGVDNDTAEAATDVKPSTMIGPDDAADEADAGVEIVDDEADPDDEAADVDTAAVPVTVVKPFTEMASPLD